MKAWLELMRAALGPTVVWDFVVGVLLAGISWHDGLWWAMASLVLIYFAGMILNDWRDRALDAEVGRLRPLIDGRIPPTTALAVAMMMFGGAYVCALRSGPFLGDFSLWLIAIVVVYDLIGADLRKHLGPALLAAARAFSISYGVIATLGAEELRATLGIATPLAYALYFLFLSRLAQREEHGVRGLNGLAFLVMAAASPALLTQFQSPSWIFYVGWLAVAALLLVPAWPHRHNFWDPKQVQIMVRRSLSLAPLIPGLCLLASSDSQTQMYAPIALLVCVLVGRLVRSYST
ncbi:MAG: UbiA family prenyltransferase [Planctomycetes bacterium]|nr:UbiA family prenyltransferase [Planctomycetota bacterium]MCP4770804.1 UbiA family prenyltransferase [Planctomycetota bacterium]MCP4861344.1 UbiA family prenyltransferase [Planctomycetota bacterium]